MHHTESRERPVREHKKLPTPAESAAEGGSRGRELFKTIALWRQQKCDRLLSSE